MAKPKTPSLFAPVEEARETVKALFYGREGSSKTTSALAAANHGRVLVINVEGGVKPSALRKRGIDTDNVVQWPNPATGEAVTFEGLEKVHRQVLDDLTEDPDSWFAVVLDSVTETVNALRENATDARVERVLRNRPNADIDASFVDRDDYGVMTNQMRKVVRRLRDLPCHVIITALEREDTDTGDLSPAVSPALGQDLLGYVDLVLYFKAGSDAPEDDQDLNYRAKTRATDSIRAKDRFSALPDPLVLPTFDRVLDYVTGEFEGKVDETQNAYAEMRAAQAAQVEAEEAEAEAEEKPARKGKKSRKAEQSDED